MFQARFPRFVVCPLAAVLLTLSTLAPATAAAPDQLGAISGTLTTLESEAPIADAVVGVWNAAGVQQTFGQTDGSGRYRIELAAPGSYFVTAEHRGHFGRLYDDLSCINPPIDCNPTTGTSVVVTPDNTTADINFALPRRPAGSITGHVLSEAVVGGSEPTPGGGEPIPFIPVTAWDLNGNSIGIGHPGLDGLYEISGLDPGTYVVTARTPGQFIDELYSDLPCPNLSCDLTTGTPVTVLDETTTSNIDFALTRLGVISGTLRDSATGQPAAAAARAWNAAGEFVDLAVPDVNGHYSIEGLSPGIYFVDTTSSEGYANELYDDLACPTDTCDRTAGTPIEVALNAPVTGIDFDLHLQQGISGRVTREDLGTPLSDVQITFWNTDGTFANTTVTDTNGRYLDGVSAGTYFVTTTSLNLTFHAIDELYDNLLCPYQLCDPTHGAPVVVNEGIFVRGIDFALAESGDSCFSTPFNLCLADDRFSAQVIWTDFEGQRGIAEVQEITDATGTIWFFGPDNIEVVVKVLDACVEPFNSFWVFAAGLTNVGVELLITDTLTGEGRTYITNPGEAFGPILDTSAFSSCLGPRTDDNKSDQLARESRRELEAQLAKLRTGHPPPPPTATTLPTKARQGTCIPTATSLCLERGRFRVESTWRTPAGETGDGQAVPLTDATGTFWFFGPDNVETLVKVLDACELPNFESFWVFAAGLTDVEVMIRVTDTVSGEVKEYLNPQSTPFLPVQDTGAFQTCGDMGG